MSDKQPAPAKNPHLSTHHATAHNADPAKAEISPTLPLGGKGQAKQEAKAQCDIYVKPSCPFSTGTIAFLCTYGMDFTVTNVEHHPEERTRVTEALGGKKFETPTLHLNGQWFVAPTLSELKRHLVDLGIAPQPQPK